VLRVFSLEKVLIPFFLGGGGRQVNDFYYLNQNILVEIENVSLTLASNQNKFNLNFLYIMSLGIAAAIATSIE